MHVDDLDLRRELSERDSDDGDCSRDAAGQSATVIGSDRR